MYTSGEWTADYSTSLDNLSSAWIPNTYFTYSDNVETLGLCDTRTIDYDQRFMITTNIIHPRCFRVTKVVDMVPQGILKISIEADDYDENRDCPEMMICDYYSDEGNVKIDTPNTIETGKNTIKYMEINDNTELVDSSELPVLKIGIPAYFECTYTASNMDWRLEIIGDYLSDKSEYYCNLISMTKFDDSTICLKAGKAKSLIGKKFKLSVCDENGKYYSSVELEVVE